MNFPAIFRYFSRCGTFVYGFVYGLLCVACHVGAWRQCGLSAAKRLGRGYKGPAGRFWGGLGGMQGAYQAGLVAALLPG